MLSGCTPVGDPLATQWGRAPASALPAVRASLDLVIETAIIAPDPFAGMKSRHTMQVDFAEQHVTQAFETGTTDFFGVSLPSVRDRFTVRDVRFPRPGVATFTVEGETASGVGVMPNINYDLHIEVRQDGGAKVSGCHDGYPGYRVSYAGREVYRFRHQPRNLIELFGSCDVEVR